MRNKILIRIASFITENEAAYKKIRNFIFLNKRRLHNLFGEYRTPDRVGITDKYECPLCFSRVEKTNLFVLLVGKECIGVG